MARFPEPADNYPVVYLKDTDKDLPKSVGTVNNLRYAYFKTIARGGKCLIQTCKDLHLGRVIVYKSLLPEIEDDKYEQQRFLREARVTSMLQHPNTIPVYELGRNSKGHYYFTMKLVHGTTLREILDGLRERDEATYSKWGDLERQMDLFIQVCQVLDYSHNHGVVHRDVKPENILAGPHGEVLLLDWGLAKVWGMEKEEVPKMSMVDKIDPTLTAQGPLQATPLYMSPEQVAESDEIDHRTDIYSLGAVLFEILTLEHMAWGETLDEMLVNTQYQRPPNPSLVTPARNIPMALETICLRCVAKDPDHRIQTVR
ncbi:MAG: serine/threonine-protein kinase, partial [Planctomycetota bacterium]